MPLVGGPEGRVGMEDLRTLGTPTIPSTLSLPCEPGPNLPSKVRPACLALGLLLL